MNKEVFDELLKRNLDGEGFPVFAALVDDDTNGILLYTWNKKSSNTKSIERYHNHSEYILLSGVDDIKDKNLNLLITLPPCSECIKSLKKLKNLKTITYLFDPWRKSQKQNGYLKIFSKDSGIPISRVDFTHQLIDDNWKRYNERMQSRGHKGSLKRLKEHQKSNVLLRF